VTRLGRAALFGAVLAAGAGCDGVYTHPAGGGAGDGPSDASSDAPPDPPPDAPLALHHYVISEELFPEAQMLGLDFNGDSIIDNQFGKMMILLADQEDLAPNAAAKNGISWGEIILLAELGADRFTAGSSATFALYTGTNPTPQPCPEASFGSVDSRPECGLHLRGDATFDVDQAVTYPPIHGTIGQQAVITNGAPGRLHIKVSFVQRSVVHIDLVAPQVQISMASDGELHGVIAGALSVDTLDKTLPEILYALSSVLDCNGNEPYPNCGCTPASQALIARFDGDKDCTISSSRLGEDMKRLRQEFPADLANGNMSFGIGFKAVKATFTPPSPP
jgi:hypothetical protein